MDTAITSRPSPSGQGVMSAPAQAGSRPTAFAALFAGAAALTAKQPAMERGTENAGPSAGQLMEAVEADPEAINELVKQHPEFEEVVMFIAELVREEVSPEGAPEKEGPEKMPVEKENIFTKLAVAFHSPEGEAAAGKAAAGEEKQLELPVLRQLAARFNDLAPRGRQVIQTAAEKLQQAAGPLLSKPPAGEEKKQAEEMFTSRLEELAALLSKVLSDNTESVRPEAALAAAAVAAEALVQESGLKAEQKKDQPAQVLTPKEMSRVEKLDILLPEKTPEVRQLISSLDDQGNADSSKASRPQLLPQMPAGWTTPAAGEKASADDAVQSIKHDLQQWQKYLSGRKEPGEWMPKALQPSSGEQPEKQLAEFTQSLSALVKKQTPVSLTAETKRDDSLIVQLEQILQSIRSEAGSASAPPAPTVGAGEPRALQPNAPLVIQLPPVSEGNQRQAEFLKHFQQTLGTMTAAQLKNGASYTIRLYPEHLGRLDVKLTKIEGQWTAQLITTSKGAQELVESSVHQLRQSFLQQNLQVERIEVAEHPDFYKEEEQKEDPEEQHEPVKIQEESSEEEERSFEDILQQLSVNERI